MSDITQEAVEAFRSDVFHRTGDRMNATVVRSGLKAALPILEQAIRNEERVKVREALLRDEGRAQEVVETKVGEWGGGWDDDNLAACARSVLDALLATLDQEGPCKRCGGSGFIDSGDPNLPIKPCPDCQPPREPCERCGGESEIRPRSYRERLKLGPTIPCPDCLDKEEEAPVAESAFDFKICPKCGVKEGRCTHGLPPITPERWNEIYSTGRPSCTEQVVEEGEAVRQAKDHQASRMEMEAERTKWLGEMAQGVSGDGEEDRSGLCGDVGVKVGALLERAALESAPQETYGEHGEESWWLQGRDDTVSFISEEVDGYIRQAFEEFAATQNQSTDTVPSGGVLGDEGTIRKRAEEMLAQTEGGSWEDATELQRNVWLSRARATVGGDA